MVRGPEYDRASEDYLLRTAREMLGDAVRLLVEPVAAWVARANGVEPLSRMLFADVKTWLADEMGSLYQRYLGPTWSDSVCLKSLGSKMKNNQIAATTSSSTSAPTASPRNLKSPFMEYLGECPAKTWPYYDAGGRPNAP